MQQLKGPSSVKLAAGIDMAYWKNLQTNGKKGKVMFRRSLDETRRIWIQGIDNAKTNVASCRSSFSALHFLTSYLRLDG